MPNYECVAMLLAGGEGKRLGPLTRKNAKPAVSFGGKYRIVDFPLSNCTNSGIDTVGVLTQYEPLVLNSYIGVGESWDLDRRHGGITILPPYVEKNGLRWYKGTANSIYQNIDFIEQYNPKYVLIISGDHIYKMNYVSMLQFHQNKKADISIAVYQVSREEASRFGIMNINSDYRITDFEEKPKNPKGNLASMGIYIFNWKLLKEYLYKDEQNPNSTNDFGKDLIPLALSNNLGLYGFPFKGYWKDVGTLNSLWSANMDLLSKDNSLDLNDDRWKIYSVSTTYPPQYIGINASINNSMINEGCIIYGNIYKSVLFNGVYIGEGSIIKDSVLMPNVKVGSNVIIERAIISEDVVVDNNSHIGTSNGDIILLKKGDENV